VVAPEIAYQQLLQRESHLGVLLGSYDHPNLVTIKSYSCGLACVMRSEHPLAKKRRITPADLAGERVITSPESTPFGQTLRRAFGSAASDMHLDIDCVSSTTATWFAQAGIGVAVVDQASIAGGLLPGLEVRPFQSHEKLEVHVVRNRYRPMSVADRAFTDLFDKIWRSVM
jgi:DNA-binding transcriptional LysR family regulator